jgi:ubiquinone/menaquinone biosynthesis C-methylase UbiE
MRQKTERKPQTSQREITSGAHIWNELFSQEHRELSVQEYLPVIASGLKAQGAKQVLDLGSGSGRHTVYLAREGFDVYGLDFSEKAIEQTKRELKKERLEALITKASMYERYPFDDCFFDAVFSIQAINHGTYDSIKRAAREIERVLKPHGYIYLTSRKKKAKGERLRFEQLDTHTYIPLEGKEQGQVHYLFTKQTLRRTFQDFKMEIWLDRTQMSSVNSFSPLATRKIPH